MLGIEVDARRYSDPGVGQQLRAEIHRVRGEVGDVGVDVKRAVGGRQSVDADFAQTAEQCLAIGCVLVQMALGFFDGFGGERRDGRTLTLVQHHIT